MEFRKHPALTRQTEHKVNARGAQRGGKSIQTDSLGRLKGKDGIWTLKYKQDLHKEISRERKDFANGTIPKGHINATYHFWQK